MLTYPMFLSHHTKFLDANKSFFTIAVALTASVTTRDGISEMQSAYFPARREGQVMICSIHVFPL